MPCTKNGTLYTWAGNTSGQAVQAAAALSGANLTVADFVPGTAPEGFPSYVHAPVMSAACGGKLTQQSAILAAMNDGNCSPCHVEWLGFAENVITPAASQWVFPTMGAMPNNKGAISEGKKSLLAALSHMNCHLSKKTFLVGERPSIADCANVGALVLAFKQVLEPSYRADIPHVVRWFQTCIHHSAFSSFGSVSLCAKEAQFDAKTFGELNKKAPKQAKKPAAKKDAPKKEAPKKEAAAEEAPKKVDPWAGPGSYDMDAWKRCYSNNDTVPVAMDYFWEKLDKENYSVWFGKYKYGDEIGMPFMASNLVRGVFQRIDKMRKHSFGSVCIFGGEEKGDLEISGVWFWKGKSLCFERSADWQVDYDTYDWSIMDMDNDADKMKVQEYFAHEGNFDGKKFYEGRVFK